MVRPTPNRTAASSILAVGVLLAALMAACLLLTVSPSYAATTFTVNSTSDDGDLEPGNGKCFTGDILVVQGKECTLRAAIQEANATSGADTVNFDIPGTGVNAISPATALPKITGPLTINGYSQPGAKPNTKAVGSDAVLKIELSGAGAPGTDGLVIGASNSTVKGLVVNRWSYAGIRIDGAKATGNRITGNYLGTDASGTQNLGNYTGIRIYYGSSNTIGGATPAERNVISANGHSGVSIGDGVVTKSNKVIGNYIGTDKRGTKDLGNSLHGVNIDGAPNTTVGGTTAGARNVISGNDEYGVIISGLDGSKVTGNYIGTDASGTRDVGNSGAGVHISYGLHNTIGGAEAGQRNVISGNDFQGIVISGAASTGNEVLGNYVGTDASGTKDLGNAEQGVFINGAPKNVVGGAQAGARNTISANDGEGVLIVGPGADGNRVMGNYVGTDKTGAALGNSGDGVGVSEASNTTIGGTTAGTRNVISANNGDGAQVYGDTATGNRVLSNSIFANGRLGIELGVDGSTANDAGDADTGPNGLQNFPVLTSARKGATGTTAVKGTLNSTPAKTFKVQYFSNPTGTDEGKTLLGSKTVTTDGSGNASFAFSTTKKVNPEQNITATATGPGGNTSEFSAPRKVVAR